MAGHRSFSAVRQLTDCGEAYRLARIERVTEQPMAAGAAGKIIHIGTEYVDYAIIDGATDKGALTLIAHKAAAEATPQVIEEELSEAYPDTASWMSFGRRTVAKPQGEDMQWFITEGIPTALANYVEWRLQNSHLQVAEVERVGETCTLYAIEIEFEIRLSPDCAPIRGAIDRVFRDSNGTPLLVDIKSGLKPKSSSQLGLYARAWQEMYGEKIQYGAYVYGLKKGVTATPPIDLSVWTDERLNQVYGTADKLIEQGLFIPKPGDGCFTCTVKRNCDYYVASIF